MTTSTPRGQLASAPTGTDRQARADAGHRHHRLRGDLLGLGAALPARRDAARAAAPDRLPAVPAGGGTGARRLARPDPGRRAHRPVRGAADVPHRGPADRPAGALPRPPRELAHRLPGRGLLPRPRRHDVRDRHPVRELVVPARPARTRPRHLRRGHGRHRHLGLHHRAAHQDPRTRLPVRPRRRRPRRLRASWPPCCCATGPTARSSPGSLLARLAHHPAHAASPCSCRSSTPSRSAGSSRSACTCPPT